VSAIQHWSQSLPELSPYYLRHRGERFGGREQLALINAKEIHPACDRDSVTRPSSPLAFHAEFARNGCESQDGIYNGLVSHSRKVTGGTYRHCNISSVVDLTSTELSSHALVTNVTACLCTNIVNEVILHKYKGRTTMVLAIFPAGSLSIKFWATSHRYKHPIE
jgi:hypothetical protein